MTFSCGSETTADGRETRINLKVFNGLEEWNINCKATTDVLVVSRSFLSFFCSLSLACRCAKSLKRPHFPLKRRIFHFSSDSRLEMMHKECANICQSCTLAGNERNSCNLNSTSFAHSSNISTSSLRSSFLLWKLHEFRLRQCSAACELKRDKYSRRESSFRQKLRKNVWQLFLKGNFSFFPRLPSFVLLKGKFFLKICLLELTADGWMNVCRQLPLT